MNGSPVVRYANGKVKTVKNLGWLLRHLGDGLSSYSIRKDNEGGAVLRVLAHNRWLFSCTFADLTVALSWAVRHVFPNITTSEYPLYTKVIGSQSFHLTYDAFREKIQEGREGEYKIWEQSGDVRTILIGKEYHPAGIVGKGTLYRDDFGVFWFFDENAGRLRSLIDPSDSDGGYACWDEDEAADELLSGGYVRELPEPLDNPYPYELADRYL